MAIEKDQWFEKLRDLAEKIAADKKNDHTDDIKNFDFTSLVHEIKVYQAELEIQNEELRRAQAELVQSRDRFSTLFHNSRADTSAYDLVLTDVSMPNMAGDRLAKELIALRPDIPIILCTGFSDRISPMKADAIGIRGILMKPVVKEEIAKTVRKVLDEAKSDRRS